MRNFNLIALSTMLLATCFAPSVLAHEASPDVATIKAMLLDYQKAIEKLNAEGTESLFDDNSQIFETGSEEGSYRTYLTHHLQPELAEFTSFKFSDYTVTVRIEGETALANESYRYVITPKSGEPVSLQGVATTVFKRTDLGWKIISMHNSGRRIKPATN